MLVTRCRLGAMFGESFVKMRALTRMRGSPLAVISMIEQTSA